MNAPNGPGACATTYCPTVKHDPSTDENAAIVSAKLSHAWELLSGEKRPFSLAPDQENPPLFAEFTYVIPMTVEEEDTTFAVGILIQREDALTVAASMFGLSRAEVPDADLRDACSEVCNIFSDCISRNVYQSDKVKVGLPFVLDEFNYKKIFEASGSGDIYQSLWNAQSLGVVVFKPSDVTS
jgi:hypothetical protein